MKIRSKRARAGVTLSISAVLSHLAVTTVDTLTVPVITSYVDVDPDAVVARKLVEVVVAAVCALPTAYLFNTALRGLARKPPAAHA